LRVKKASIERSSPSTCSSFDTGNNKMGGDYVKIFGKIFQNNVLVDDPMKKSASTPTLSSLNNDNEVVDDPMKKSASTPTLSSLNNDNEVVADSGYLSDCIGTVQRKAVRERKKGM
jgi:hypothetical protein